MNADTNVDTKPRKVFISYSGLDRERVTSVARELDREGIAHAFAHDHIPFGGDIVQWIDEQLRESTEFVMFLSRNYLGSEWTKAEYRAATWMALAERGMRVQVVSLDASTPPALATSLKRIAWTTAREVAAAIIGRPQPSDVPGVQTIEPADLSRRELNILATRLVERMSELIRVHQPTEHIDIAGPPRALRFEVHREVATDRRTLVALAHERNLEEQAFRVIYKLRERLVKGGLGVFGPAFEVELEDYLKTQGACAKRVRELVADLCQRIVVLT